MEFLRRQIAAGKTIYLSHNPYTATKSFLKEVEYLQSEGFRFIFDDVENLWRAIK